MHWNAENVTNKKTELEHILHERNMDVCCIQETHLQSNAKKTDKFKIRGYQCHRNDRNDRKKGGVMTLVRNNIKAVEMEKHVGDSEYHVLRLQTKTADVTLLNYYCPNDKPLSLDNVTVSDNNFLAVGDFNSHSQSWGYNHLDNRGEEVEKWQDDNNLILLNKPTDQATF